MKRSAKVLFAAQLATLVAMVGSANTTAAESAAPLDKASRLDKALQAMVQMYPDLTSGPEWAGGIIGLSMAVKTDGAVIYHGSTNLRQSPQSGISTDELARLGIDLTAGYRETPIPDAGFGVARILKGQPIAGVGKATSDIGVNYYMLPADFDESHGAAKVADAVREKHTELMRAGVALVAPEKFRSMKRVALANGGMPSLTGNSTRQPRPASPPSTTDTQVINLLTVFMTEDGRIAREIVEQKRVEELQSVYPLPVESGSITIDAPPYNAFNPPPVPAEAFKGLGLEPGQIGATGYLIVYQIGTRERPVNMTIPPGVVVRYAWPRAGEPIGGK